MNEKFPSKCIHIVPGISQEASGPSYSVPRLCEEMSKQDLNVQLWVSDLPPTRSYPFPVRWFPPVGPFHRRLGRSPQMREALRSEVCGTDILHNHSLWMMPNIYPGVLIHNTKCKLITSPRGTLSAWALKRHSIRKKLLLILGQRYVLQRATCLHATSFAEYDDIRKFGLKQPVAVIPNGVDLPSIDEKCGNHVPSEKKILLYLGRVHPVKGLSQLVDAWRVVESRLKNWELHIVGPGEQQHIRALKQQIAETHSIQYRSASYGAQKAMDYRNANAYILPSHSENFAMTVAEALSYQLPCIVSQGAPWAGLEENRCGWWVRNDPGSLSNAIYQMTQLPQKELAEMGVRGRIWVEKDYGWKSISNRMALVYAWMLGDHAPLDFMKLA